MNKPEAYKAFAEQRLKEIKAEFNPAPLFRTLCQEVPDFEKVPKGDFLRELMLAVLACSCIAWETACLENEIREDSVQKAFLRAVMKTFESATQQKEAEAFSGYLFADGSDDLSLAIVGITQRFFESAGQSAAGRPVPNSQTVPAAFRLLVEYFEGCKNDLHQRFEDFHFSQLAS